MATDSILRTDPKVKTIQSSFGLDTAGSPGSTGGAALAAPPPFAGEMLPGTAGAPGPLYPGPEGRNPAGGPTAPATPPPGAPDDPPGGTSLDGREHVDICVQPPGGETAATGEGSGEGLSPSQVPRPVGQVLSKWRKERWAMTPATCGSVYTVKSHLKSLGGCGAKVGQAMTCGDRVGCVPCAKRAASVLQESLRPVLNSISRPRLLTLTLKNVPAGELAAMHKKMGESWAKLRRRKFFKERCSGGVWADEVTWSPKAGTWHLHLHAVLAGRFLPQGEISAAWLDITKDSYVVDIRPADRETVGRELVKYITKPWGIPEVHLKELAAVFKGRRRADVWGSCRNVKRAQRPKVRCPGCGSAFVYHEWESENVTAKEFRRMQLSGPLWRDVYDGWDVEGRAPPDPDLPPPEYCDAAG